MNAKKFYVNRFGIFLILFFAILQIGAEILLAGVSVTSLYVIIPFLFYLLLILHFFFGTYLVIDNEAIYSVAYPFINRKIPFKSIRSVALVDYGILLGVHMLVVETNLDQTTLTNFGKVNFFRVGNDAQFGKEAITEIVKIIVKKVPTVKLNQGAQKLL